MFSRLVVVLVDDLAHNGQGQWELVEPLTYTDKQGEAHVVPAGFRTDFASVPRAPGVYAMFGNRAHRPAVLHDYYCHTATDKRSRSRGDDLFLEAMLGIGIPSWRARIMYNAVRGYTERIYPEDDEDIHSM